MLTLFWEDEIPLNTGYYHKDLSRVIADKRETRESMLSTRLADESF